MVSFQYEKQGEKEYLVYQKRDSEDLDTFTTEMLSNNRIPGLVPFSYIQMDQSISMKYNITGLVSLETYLENTVKKGQFLKILKSLCDAVMQAEDYMLDVSAYVFDETYIFADPETFQAHMVVLPVRHESVAPEDFFKKLLFDVKYDQTEDCTYVASLMNLLRGDGEFSFSTFKEELARFQSQGGFQGKEIKGAVAVEKPEQRKQIPAGEGLVNQGQMEKRASADTGRRGTPTWTGTKEAEERKEWLDILFSGEEEEPEKKKRGLFSKKEKKEKEDKKEKGLKRFFGKKGEKEKENTLVRLGEENPLKGLAIPGMDMLGGSYGKEEFSQHQNAEGFSAFGREPVPVPAQNVNIPQMDAGQEDFGETEYYGEDMEETLMIGQEESSPRAGFTLYRCSTEETFEIRGEVIRIGRSPSISEICLSGNRGIGRTHAILYVRDGNVYIADNNSKNKTYVDGEQVRPGEQPRLLLSGSKIRLGDEELEFRISR